MKLIQTFPKMQQEADTVWIASQHAAVLLGSFGVPFGGKIEPPEQLSRRRVGGAQIQSALQVCLGLDLLLKRDMDHCELGVQVWIVRTLGGGDRERSAGVRKILQLVLQMHNLNLHLIRLLV